MSPVSVHVELGGITVHAGVLHSHRRHGTESATFVYTPAYLAVPSAYALDPALPLVAGAHQSAAGARTFGAFTDCAPDRWGRTLLRRREERAARAEGRAQRALSEADHLLGVRDDLRQGALRFRAGTGTGAGPFLADEEHGVPALTDLPELLDLASRAENDDADLPDLMRLMRAGSSLGGARPKAHVRTADGNLAIAKFPSAAHDTWDVMAWEKVALDLAARAGVLVPSSLLLDLAGRRVLVADRFDRTHEGSRIGYAKRRTVTGAATSRSPK